MDDCAFNKNFKIGDKVVCVKDFYWENKLLFLADRFYIIRHLENYKNNDLVKIDDIFFTTTKGISNFYFKEYFQTIAEYRQTRIEQILE